MRPLSSTIRAKIDKDPFFLKCCFCGLKRQEVNHALIYSGRQIEDYYALTPLCTHCHRGNNGTIWPEVKVHCELMAIVRGGKELLAKYPKYDWAQRKIFLERSLLKKINRQEI